MSNKLNRFWSLLGILGTLLCGIGILGVWLVESRIDRTREQVFEIVDDSLAGVHDRFLALQRLVGESKVDVEEVHQTLVRWTREAASERLNSRIQVGARVEQLAGALRQADLLLDASLATAQNIRQTLEMGAELGLPMQTESVNLLLERLAAVQSAIRTAVETADDVGRRIQAADEGEPPKQAIEQAAKITARLLATFGNLDARLRDFETRLTDTRDAVKQLDAKTHFQLVTVAVCATLFLLWMAAGQFCMSRRARKS